MVKFLVGTLTGIVSGCGIGGGSLLILWLTAVEGAAQAQAAGINLVYFLCCAPAALVSHIRQHRIDWSAAGWCALSGCIAAPVFSYLAGGMETDLLRRLFGVLILILGLRELFSRPEKKPPTDGAFPRTASK